MKRTMAPVRRQPAPGGAAARHRRPSPCRDFLFGVAYYPEHWSERERRRDVARMRASGINVVRMGEFAWDVWEPRPGCFAFDLFDDVISALGRAGIRTILGTPTAAPPRWLTQAHPEILRETADGRITGHGARQHVNLVHPVFRAASRAITDALARHYARNPHVIGWQIDNELHCIGDADFSPATGQAFQRWLRARYRTIAALNRSWGTRFNAGTFDCFEDIPLPLRDRAENYPPHPGQLLDFRRFISDTTCAFAHEQVEILRAANRRWLIFHNGLFRHLDYWKLGASLDWLGIDLYPGFGGEGTAAQMWSATKLELARAHSGSFLVPELASGAGGSRSGFLETPEPGQMRLWAWQCVAHGADGIVHFRWRTCRAGQEIHWHGVLDHDDAPRRRLAELRGEAREFRRVARLLSGTVAEVRIGVLVDFEADEFHDAVMEKQPAPRHQAEHLLTALLARHLPAGLVHASDRFDGLEVLLLPSFAHIDADLAARLTKFVRGGGTLICNAGTGRRDQFNRALPVTPPGPLTRLLGVTVEETGFFRSPTLGVGIDDGRTLSSPHGYEILAPGRTAQALAVWRMIADTPPNRVLHPAVGRAAITSHRVGRGRSITCGMWFDAAGADAFVDWLAREIGCVPFVEAPAGVTARVRVGKSRRLLFLLNHAPHECRITHVPTGRDLLRGGRVVGDELTLAGYDVAVLELR